MKFDRFDLDAENETVYTQYLAVTLLLESDGKKKKLYSSNIEKFELELQPYGFEALVHFSGFENEELEEVFNSEKPIKAALTYQTKELISDKKDPITVKGIVYERLSRGIEKREKEVRVYQIRFCDGAKASWSSHFTKAVYIDKTMKDVIDAEKNPMINIEYDFEKLTEEHPILAFSLEDDYHIPVEKKISFYSFLNWYLHQEGGVLEYNYKDDKYKILGKKGEEGEPLHVAESLVTSPRCIYPVPPRTVNKKMKHYPDRIEDETDENDKGYDAVRKDWYEDDTYIQFPEQNGLNVRSPPVSEKIEANFWIKKFEEKFQFDKLFPGIFITFKGLDKIGGEWCDHSDFKGKDFRIRKTKIKAVNQDIAGAIDIECCHYALTIEVLAEAKDETYIPRPSYHVPKYPFFILGTVFSKIGDEEQTTFNVAKDEKAPLGKYQVKVPLSGEEEKYVIVPFSPDYMTGQYYFPFCKNQEVMLKVEFKTAKIERVVNWQPLAELPEGVQGCQIVWSSNGINQYVIQKHEFEDGKNSVLTLKQSSSEDQVQIVTVKEKDITIQVEEKGKRTTQIQLNRDSGLLIKVKDDGAGITNSTLYDDKGVTHMSEGNEGTSTIVQKPGAIEVKANKVAFSCDEFEIDAKKTVAAKAASKITLDTPLAQSTKEFTVG